MVQNKSVENRLETHLFIDGVIISSILFPISAIASVCRCSINYSLLPISVERACAVRCAILRFGYGGKVVAILFGRAYIRPPSIQAWTILSNGWTAHSAPILAVRCVPYSVIATRSGSFLSLNPASQPCFVLHRTSALTPSRAPKGQFDGSDSHRKIN